MPKLELITSPRGVAKFPHLDKPDTKFDPEGVYKLTLVCTPDVGEKFAEKLDAAYEASIEKALQEDIEAYKKKNPKGTKPPTEVRQADKPYKIDDETGNYEFAFKVKATGKDDKTGKTWSNRPAMYDAAKNKLDPEEAKVGGGSVVRVAAELNPFYMKGPVGAGLSLRLKGVQVIELRSYGELTADAMGFDMEDEGDFEDNQEESTSGGSDDNGGDF